MVFIRQAIRRLVLHDFFLSPLGLVAGAWLQPGSIEGHSYSYSYSYTFILAVLKETISFLWISAEAVVRSIAIQRQRGATAIKREGRGEGQRWKG